MKKVDYHLHSYMSDGVLSPEELVKTAISCNCSEIAITDHEIVDDYKWLSDKYHIEVINGIEFNSSIRNMHLLGYGMNDLGRVNETMLKIRLMNEKVCLKVIEKLQNDGYDISSSKVLDYLSKEGLNTDILDKRKLVKYLIYKKYSDSVIGAYNNLIGVGKKYYIQVAYSLEDEKTYNREFRPFANLDNTNKKIIITNDELDYSTSTVVHLKLKDFLELDSLDNV